MAVWYYGMRIMNILFLSTENPYPPDHGHHIRTYYILKQLAQGNKIYFIGFAQHPDELKYIKHLERFCKSVDIYSIPSRNYRMQKQKINQNNCINN